MSEVLGDMKQVRKDIEDILQDKEYAKTLRSRAAVKMEQAFALMDEACAFQAEIERVIGIG